MQPLVVSSYTTANCLGAGRDALYRAVRDRRTGLAPCAFETVDLETYVGQVPDAELTPLRDDLSEFECRNNRLAQLGLRQDGFEQDVARARERYGAARVGVFLGTSTSGILQTELAYRRRDPASGALPSDFRYAQTHNTFSPASFVQRYLGLTGPAVVVSSACSSSAKVFGNAQRMIAAGLCDAAVVGGVDSLCLTTLYGFNSLQLVSRQPCRPFDGERDGISIGEAVGFVLLEKNADASPEHKLGVLGIGESCDAYHMSTPHPEGLGARLAMQSALAMADLNSADIDYINLHGTATRTNDATEDLAVHSLFGGDTPASSTKGWTGHTLGAAGIIEAIISLIAIEEGLLPGSMNTQNLDPATKIHYLLENKSASVRYVMSNSFGFGGTNCSLVLGRLN
jgi:3-oxoacyl-[acyl-carrier-protein] synthase I